jgi:very-short-patch-repair endonuclease
MAMLQYCGISPKMIHTQVAAGTLVRLRRGVFVAAAAMPSDDVGRHLIRARAEQAVHPQAVVSHASAALAWNLPFPGFGHWTQQPVSVTLPSGGSDRSRTGEVIRHIGPLPRSAIRQHHGYAVTSVSRTAVDLTARLNLPESLALMDAAARVLVESYVGVARRRDYLNSRMVEAARAELRESAVQIGAAAIRPVIELVQPARESAAESLSAGYLHLASLPEPEYQARIVTASGTFYPDCLWRERRLIGECDGVVKYADPHAYGQEKLREQALRDAGYAMVRWLAKEIMAEPAAVVERVRRALGE